MHFIDFLLHLLCIIIAAIRSIYKFCEEFIVPAVVYVLPVLLKCLGHLTTGFLWIFFTYFSPCIIHVLNIIVHLFARFMNGIGYMCLSVMEIDTKFVNVPAIVISISAIAIIYFRLTEKVFNFCNDGWQLTQMNVRFFLHFIKMLSKFVTYVYRRIVTLFKREATTKNVTRKWVLFYSSSYFFSSYMCNLKINIYYLLWQRLKYQKPEEFGVIWVYKVTLCDFVR